MAPEQTETKDMLMIPPQGEITLLDEVAEARRQRERTVAKLRLLWEQRRFLGKVLLYGILGSLLLAFVIPARYESTVRLMPPDQGSSGLASMLSAFAGKSGLDDGGSLGGLTGVASDVLGLKTSSDLFIGILQSRTVEDDLINKFDLRKVYWDRKMEDARKELAKKTDISVDRRSGIITINVTDHSPQRAAAMARQYVDQLNLVLVNLNTSAAHRERVFLEGRLMQVKQDLEVAEKNFSQFSSKNATLDIKAQGVAMVEAGATLEGQLIAAQTQLEALRQIYSDNNVRIRSVQARIDELKRQLQKIGGKTGGASDADDQYVDSLYPTIRKLPLLGVNYADLYRETRVDEATFEMLTQEYELAKVEEAKELPSVKVLDQPDIPGKKSFPPRPAIVALGACLSLCFGILFVFGTESWRAIDPQDPGKMLASEVWIQLKEHGPWIAANGSGAGNGAHGSQNRNGSQDLSSKQE